MDQEVNESADFAKIVGISHLKKAREALRDGKEEIAATHLQRARDAFTDALVATYPQDAWNSGDLITIKQERERRQLPTFVVADKKARET